MKDLINRILKALNIGGRDWAVLLLALLLAFSIWVIHNLSLKYNDYLTVSVAARCSIDGHSALASNTCDVVARGRATGYKVLKFNMPGRKQAVTIDFSSSVMKHKEGDLYYVTSDALQEYTHLMYGSGVSIEYFVTDTLFYRFPVVNCIKVPVLPVTSLTYDMQYMSDGQISVSPDSVYVYGEPHRLETVSQVYTKPIKYSNLKSNVSGIADLEKVRGVTFSETQVSYSLDVVRYVEMNSVAQVRCVNLPADKELMAYPSSVNVTLKCAYPLPANFDNSPDVYVDYNDFVVSVSGKCKVYVESKGSGIIESDVDPAYVECMLVEK
jgi:hypothetical protein